MLFPVLFFGLFHDCLSAALPKFITDSLVKNNNTPPEQLHKNVQLAGMCFNAYQRALHAHYMIGANLATSQYVTRVHRTKTITAIERIDPLAINMILALLDFYGHAKYAGFKDFDDGTVSGISSLLVKVRFVATSGQLEKNGVYAAESAYNLRVSATAFTFEYLLYRAKKGFVESLNDYMCQTAILISPGVDDTVKTCIDSLIWTDFNSRVTEQVVKCLIGPVEYMRACSSETWSLLNIRSLYDCSILEDVIKQENKTRIGKHAQNRTARIAVSVHQSTHTTTRLFTLNQKGVPSPILVVPSLLLRLSNRLHQQTIVIVYLLTARLNHFTVKLLAFLANNQRNTSAVSQSVLNQMVKWSKEHEDTKSETEDSYLTLCRPAELPLTSLRGRLLTGSLWQQMFYNHRALCQQATRNLYFAFPKHETVTSTGFLSYFIVGEGYINKTIDELRVLKHKVGIEDLAFKYTLQSFAGYVNHVIMWNSIDQSTLDGIFRWL